MGKLLTSFSQLSAVVPRVGGGAMCVCGGSDGAIRELLSFKASAIANTTAKNHCCRRPTTATIQRNANAETRWKFTFQWEKNNLFATEQLRAACAGRPFQFPYISGNVNVLLINRRVKRCVLFRDNSVSEFKFEVVSIFLYYTALSVFLKLVALN